MQAYSIYEYLYFEGKANINQHNTVYNNVWSYYFEQFFGS